MEVDKENDSWEEEDFRSPIATGSEAQHQVLLPLININVTSADDEDWGDQDGSKRSGQNPNMNLMPKSARRVKRLSGEIRNAAEDFQLQPPEKCWMVDDAVAHQLVGPDKFTPMEDDGAMDTGADLNDEHLKVPNFDPTPEGSPRKKAARQYTNSPYKSDFIGNQFQLVQSPRKRLEF